MKRTPMPRRTKPLPRSSSLAKGGTSKRKAPVKRKPRPAEETARIYGPVEFRDWLHAEPCAICGYVGATEQVHAKGGGMGRKADWTATFPGCGPHQLRTAFGVAYLEGCHRRLHRVGVASFEKDHGVSLLALAALTQQRYAACRSVSSPRTGE